MFEYYVQEEEKYAKVLFLGDMDIEITETVENEMIPELEKFQHVEINMSSVPFVDSTGIGLFMKLIQHLKEQKVYVIITNINQQVFEVFDLLQIPDILGRELFKD